MKSILEILIPSLLFLLLCTGCLGEAESAQSHSSSSTVNWDDCIEALDDWACAYDEYTDPECADLYTWDSYLKAQIDICEEWSKLPKGIQHPSECDDMPEQYTTYKRGAVTPRDYRGEAVAQIQSSADERDIPEGYCDSDKDCGDSSNESNGPTICYWPGQSICGIQAPPEETPKSHCRADCDCKEGYTCESIFRSCFQESWKECTPTTCKVITCEDGYECVDGGCAMSCDSDRDCKRGNYCGRKNTCVRYRTCGYEVAVK